MVLYLLLPANPLPAFLSKNPTSTNKPSRFIPLPMALSLLRLRKALALSSCTSSSAIALLKHQPPPSALPTTTPSPFAPAEPRALCSRPHLLSQHLSFRSSPVSLNRREGFGEGKIGPDEILFEGCDYNHWLITMDFPKDPKPTPEQMVETYVETLAKVVGSREEAMKRMYACSTTTYTGFQAVMTEEMSEKFRGLPGVVFILPDSYIDPVNKEYGGDKYEMGKITPRPPPVQYGRQGRYGDRNRNYDRPRYDRPRDPMPMQQGNTPYDRRGPMQGDNRSYAPQQQYGSTGQQGRQSYDQQSSAQGHGVNYPPQQNHFPTGQQGDPSYYHRGPMQSDANGTQQGYGQVGGKESSYSPERRDYAPGGRDNYQAERRDYAPGGRDNYQAERRAPMQSYQMNFSQGEHGKHGAQEQGGFPQGQYGDCRNASSFGSRDYRWGPTSENGQNPGPGEAQSFQAMENRGRGQGHY